MNNKLKIIFLGIFILAIISAIVYVVFYLCIGCIETYSPQCKEGASLILIGYSCNPINGELTLNLKNYGKYNIDGFFILVSNETKGVPNIILISENNEKGFYTFSSKLEPNDNITVKFSKNMDSDKKIEFLKTIQIKPFIKNKDKKIDCKNSVIEMNIDNCNLG